MSASLHRAPRGSVPRGSVPRRRRVLAQGLLAAGALLTGLPPAAQAQAQPKVEITLARFFGACDADFGTVTDVARARGECGIITTLVNRFNATNSLGAVVKPQIAEWARTGHLPVSRKVIDSAGFRALPMRAQILEIASTGQAMPPAVPRQRAVETIVGEEISNLMLAGKALPEVQAAVEQRVNRLLATAR